MYVMSFRLCMAITNVCFCTEIHLLPTSKPGPDDGPVSPVSMTRRLLVRPLM